MRSNALRSRVRSGLDPRCCQAEGAGCPCAPCSVHCVARAGETLACIFRDLGWVPEAASWLVFRLPVSFPARLFAPVGGVPRALGSFLVAGMVFGWSAGCEGRGPGLLPQRLCQQQATGLRGDSGAVSGHHDLGTAGGKLHAESAF